MLLMGLFLIPRKAFQDGTFFRGRIKSNDGGEVFVIISPKLLPEIAKTTELQADATFGILIGLYEQLITLHISHFGQVKKIDKNSI